MFAQIVSFFTILQCAFPGKRHMFRYAQKIVRPAIDIFYNNMRLPILREIMERHRPVHLSMDGQFDSPGHNAYCTVTAIESMSRKVIHMATVKKQEVNNRSPNAEPAAFRHVLNDLLQDIAIQSVTTDNNLSLNKMFREEYPEIEHFIDLWHVLRNMFKKFLPKFKEQVSFC